MPGTATRTTRSPSSNTRRPSGRRPSRRAGSTDFRYRRTMDSPGHATESSMSVSAGAILRRNSLKERGIEAYHGIDVVKGYLPSARALFEANCLTDASIDLEIGDLFELTGGRSGHRRRPDDLRRGARTRRRRRKGAAHV